MTDKPDSPKRSAWWYSPTSSVLTSFLAVDQIADVLPAIMTSSLCGVCMPWILRYAPPSPPLRTLARQDGPASVRGSRIWRRSRHRRRSHPGKSGNTKRPCVRSTRIRIPRAFPPSRPRFTISCGREGRDIGEADTLLEAAERAELDPAEPRTALYQRVYAERTLAPAKQAHDIGITNTPTNFLGPAPMSDGWTYYASAAVGDGTAGNQGEGSTGRTRGPALAFDSGLAALRNRGKPTVSLRTFFPSLACR